MSYAEQILDIYRTSTVDASVLAVTIEAMNDCAQACTADADADLGDSELANMIACVRLCLDCADVCTATARVVSRQTAHEPAVLRPLLQACAAICARCGDECQMHAHTHAHCRICQDACRRCEQACRDLLAATS